MNVPVLSEYRCPDCKKLLFKGVLIDSAIEIKCPRCKGLKKISGDSGSKYMCGVYPCPHRIPIQK